MKPKTWVIGDVHGAARAVRQCFERSGIDFENDTLITLGDICDGWSEVKEALDEILKVKHRIDIQGNHDWWFDQWMRTGVNPVSWMQGGDATAESYIRAATTEEIPIHLRPYGGGWVTNLCNIDIPKSHQEFFGHQIPYYVDDKNRIFVHGGFDRDLPITENDHSELMWDRSLWRKAMSCVGEQKLVTADNFSEIFIGHTATVNFLDKAAGKRIDTPMHCGGVWNLDTGAGFKGKLTILNVDTKEYFQSDFVDSLYPDENGRNR